MVAGNLRISDVVSFCRMATDKLRRSDLMVAPHRARCNEARRAKLRRAKVWGNVWPHRHGHRRCPIITRPHIVRRIRRTLHVSLFETGQYQMIGFGMAGWYYRTSSMPFSVCIPIPHTFAERNFALRASLRFRSMRGYYHIAAAQLSDCHPARPYHIAAALISNCHPAR